MAGLISVPTLDQIWRDPGCVIGLPPDAAAAQTIKCVAVLAALSTLTASALLSAKQTVADEGSRFALSLAEGAQILGVSPRWLREHRELPFVKRLSRKNIVCDEPLLRKWRDSRTAA